MREVVEITAREIVPAPLDVLRNLGDTCRAGPNERMESMTQGALSLLARHSAPVGLLAEISAGEFEAVYRGEGKNEPETPLQEIFPRADHLALFAVTLGEAVSAKIAKLFETRDFALASILDAAASEGAEKAGDIVERRFLELIETHARATTSMMTSTEPPTEASTESLTSKASAEPPTGASDEPLTGTSTELPTGASTKLLRYSPGYCGWHISGQKALFAALRPEEIGISLRESFLMEPLKSISGVIVGGPGRIHEFEPSYPFCAECKSRSCRERIKHVLGR